MKSKLAKPASVYDPLPTVVAAIVNRQAKPRLFRLDDGCAFFVVSLKDLGIDQLSEQEIVTFATRWNIDFIGELLLRCNLGLVESVISETPCYKELVALNEHQHFGVDVTKDGKGQMVLGCHIALFSVIMAEAMEIMAHESRIQPR